MAIGDLRGLVRSLNFAVHGVPATVTPVDGEPVETTVIWLTPDTTPIGAAGSARADTRRGLAIRSDEVSTVQRGTIVEATEPNRAAPTRWRVDAMERVESEHVRCLVVPIEEEES